MEEETSNEPQQPTDNPDVQAEPSETDSNKDVDNSDELTGGKGMNLQTGNLFKNLEKKMVKAKRILGPRKKLKVILRI